MVDFSQVRAQAIQPDAAAEYVMYGISINGEHPVLTVRPAAEVNKAYFNARLKKTAPRLKSMRAGASIDAALLDETRAEDRELYPRYIVTGWTKVADPENPDGTPFNRENCTDFLEALPTEEFDKLRQFCEDTVNFKPDAVMPEDARALGKN